MILIIAIIIIAIGISFLIYRKFKKKYVLKTAGDLWNKYKSWNTKQIITEIILTAADLNKSKPLITDEYYKQLSNVSKRKLIRTLLVLKRANTLRIQGVSHAEASQN